jgi:hypothetical protein
VVEDVRRALLHTLPYAVDWRASDKLVVVLAVLHLRRNPTLKVSPVLDDVRGNPRFVALLRKLNLPD